MFGPQFLQGLYITFLGGFGQVFAFFRVQHSESPDGQMRYRGYLQGGGDLRCVIVRVSGQADLASLLRLNVHAPGHQGQCGYGCD